MKRIMSIMLLAAGLSLSGCQSGKLMDYQNIQANIVRNVTTEQQLRAIYGEPVEVHTDSKAGTRTLIYRYNNNDNLKKSGAGILGAVAGGLLGNQIGDGLGKAVATTVGAAAAGTLANNAVTTRSKKQTLSVVISLASGRVIDYRFNEDGSRTQSWRPASGPGTL